MTLYLKYRSQTIDELDIKDVRVTLSQILKSGSVPHSLLFLGPKGTGKTSAARILAKAVNCEKPTKDGEPCNKCETCTSISKGENLDVIEIDAASNRGIDDIRGLRDAVKLSPISSKMKVYIIDEAHMLTTEASNALLKTLEEPPSHVMFILATTNPEKLIETIRSRTTNVLFRKALTSEIVRALTRVVKGEGVKSDESDLTTIAEFADGSFRDAVKLLDQLISGKKALSHEDLLSLIFGKGNFDINVFIKTLENKSAKEAVQIIEKASESGVSAKNIIIALSSKLKVALLAKVGIGVDDLSGFSKEEVLSLLKFLSEASGSSLNSIIDQVALEMAIIEWCNGQSRSEGKPQKNEKEVISDKGETSESKTPTAEVKTNDTLDYKPEKVVGDSDTISNTGPGLDEEIWLRIMSLIRPINASTEALLRASHPLNIDGHTLNLAVYYKFHKERLEGAPHRRILEDTLSQVMGDHIKVVCTLAESPVRTFEPSNNNQVNGNSGDLGIDVIVQGTVLPKSDLVLTETKDSDIIKVAEEIFGN